MVYKDLANLIKKHFLQDMAKNIKGLPNYGNVSKGLSRSGQPNATGLEHLKQMGVDIIIKLSRDNEFSGNKEAELFGGRVISKPLNLTTITKEDGLSIASLINKELDKGNRVHVHCKYGIDRTGLIIGAWQLRYNGSTLSSVKATWKKFGGPVKKVQVFLEEIFNSK